MTRRDGTVYLITGATGNVGFDLIGKLAAADGNNEIRCCTRDPGGKAAKPLQGLGSNVVPVAFDDQRSETLKTAFAGATHVYLLPPFIPDMVEWHERVLSAAKSAGSVQFLVKHSVMGARQPTPESMPGAIPLMHYRGEEVVADSGILYSVIRPTIFAQHFTLCPWVYQRGDDVFYLPLGEGRVAFLDSRDIGTLAAHLLTQAKPDAYHGRIFHLTGPAAVAGSDIAHALSAAAQREIHYIDPPEDEYARRILAMGAEPYAAKNLQQVYHDCKEGWLGRHIAQDYSEELKTPATSFSQFAMDHASHFVKAG